MEYSCIESGKFQRIIQWDRNIHTIWQYNMVMLSGMKLLMMIAADKGCFVRIQHHMCPSFHIRDVHLSLSSFTSANQTQPPFVQNHPKNLFQVQFSHFSPRFPQVFPPFSLQTPSVFPVALPWPWPHWPRPWRQPKCCRGSSVATGNAAPKSPPGRDDKMNPWDRYIYLYIYCIYIYVIGIIVGQQ